MKAALIENRPGAVRRVYLVTSGRSSWRAAHHVPTGHWRVVTSGSERAVTKTVFRRVVGACEALAEAMDL